MTEAESQGDDAFIDPIVPRIPLAEVMGSGSRARIDGRWVEIPYPTIYDSIYDFQEVNAQFFTGLTACDTSIASEESQRSYRDVVSHAVLTQSSWEQDSGQSFATPENPANVVVRIWNPRQCLFAEAKAIIDTLIGWLIPSSASIGKIMVQFEEGYPATPVHDHVAVVSLESEAGRLLFHIPGPPDEFWSHSVVVPPSKAEQYISDLSALTQAFRSVPPVEVPRCESSMELKLASGYSSVDRIFVCWSIAWALQKAGRLELGTLKSLSVFADPYSELVDHSFVLLAAQPRVPGFLNY